MPLTEGEFLEMQAQNAVERVTYPPPGAVVPYPVLIARPVQRKTNCTTCGSLVEREHRCILCLWLDSVEA